MDEILRDLSAPALAKAVEANQCVAFAHWRHWPQAQVHDGVDLLWSITHVPFAFFNFVLRARLEPQNVDTAIEAAIARATVADVPIEWYTGPTTRPSDLGSRLLAHGFADEGDSPGMAVDLHTLNESLPALPGLSIRPVRDIETLRGWSRALTIGFGTPDFAERAMFDLVASAGLGKQPLFRPYVGLLNGEPVATSMLILGAGVAGIYAVATVPEKRRQGIGAAMTLAPLRQAREEGYRAGILQSSSMGKRVYSQLGFRECCKIGQYGWPSGGQNP